jgi:hypothetical protein
MTGATLASPAVSASDTIQTVGIHISPSAYAITSSPRSWLARVTDGLNPSAAARRILFKPLVMTLCGEVAQRRAGWDRSDEYHRTRWQ